MSKRKCHLCGKDPAEGFASIWTASEGERWYCHGDDDESPTCYMTTPTDIDFEPDGVVFVYHPVDPRTTARDETRTP